MMPILRYPSPVVAGAGCSIGWQRLCLRRPLEGAVYHCWHRLQLLHDGAGLLRRGGMMAMG